MLLQVTKLILLAVVVSTQDQDDPHLFLPVSLKFCHTTLMSETTKKGDGSTIPEVQTQLIKDQGIKMLQQYLYMYKYCFDEIWKSCISPQSIQVDTMLDITTAFPCSMLSVAVRPDAAFLHTITTRSVFQINLTFTEFVLRRSYAGCTTHRVEVCNTFMSRVIRYLKYNIIHLLSWRLSDKTYVH